tara:strand:- start:16 stop:264 length:249 start_codon:yes stop_codon:yes gene_type:complete
MEIVGILILLCVSFYLAWLNYQILNVTVEMLQVTVDIKCISKELLVYTKKTYEALSVPEDLTDVSEADKIIQMNETKEVSGG